MIESNDLVNSFDNLIDEYEKLINENQKKRNRRSTGQQPNTSNFAWRCVRNVNHDELSSQPQMGAKFLTWGGRVIEEQVADSGNKIP